MSYVLPYFSKFKGKINLAYFKKRDTSRQVQVSMYNNRKYKTKNGFPTKMQTKNAPTNQKSEKINFKLLIMILFLSIFLEWAKTNRISGKTAVLIYRYYQNYKHLKTYFDNKKHVRLIALNIKIL